MVRVFVPSHGVVCETGEPAVLYLVLDVMPPLQVVELDVEASHRVVDVSRPRPVKNDEL